MSSTTTRSEIALGCALPIDYLAVRDVRLRVHCGFRLQFRLKRLVESRVAEIQRVDGAIWVRRGPHWGSFYDMHGYADTQDGLAQLDLEAWFSRHCGSWGRPSRGPFFLFPGQRVSLRPPSRSMGNVVPFVRPSAF